LANGFKFDTFNTFCTSRKSDKRLYEKENINEYLNELVLLNTLIEEKDIKNGDDPVNKFRHFKIQLNRTVKCFTETFKSNAANYYENHLDSTGRGGRPNCLKMKGWASRICNHK
jgi:hypothetical protein